MLPKCPGFGSPFFEGEPGLMKNDERLEISLSPSYSPRLAAAVPSSRAEPLCLPGRDDLE